MTTEHTPTELTLTAIRERLLELAEGCLRESSVGWIATEGGLDSLAREVADAWRAMFGMRHVALVEGWEVACCRTAHDADSGVPLAHWAAALLHVAGVTSEMPTWEVGQLMRAARVGPPYGLDEVASATRRAALALCGVSRETE